MRVLRIVRASERRMVSPRWGVSPSALLLLGLAGSWAGSLVGCGSVEPVAPAAAPITDPTQLYMALTLDHPAVTLSTVAPYNTLQLLATPRDALDSAMSGLPAPSFKSSDTTSVTVTADGLVTALQPTEGVKVIARLSVGPVTHVDTAVINVTTLTSPPTLASLSIHPVQGDSAVWPVFFSAPSLVRTIFNLSGDIPFGFEKNTLTPLVLDATGAELSGLPVAYASLDPAVATVDRWLGIWSRVHPGQVRVVAQTTAYGITKADTATFTVTLPTYETFSIVPGPSGAPVFDMNEVRIRSYGLVTWKSTVADSVDVVFDDPTNVAMPPTGGCGFFPLLIDAGFADPGSSCGVGDLVVTPHLGLDPDGDGLPTLWSVQLRQFPVPGIYPFHSVRLGVSGRVIVTDDPNGNALMVP